MNLSIRISSLEESATLAITEKAGRLKAAGKDIIALTAGEPDFDTPQYIKDAAIAAIKEGFTKYTPASGIPALKKAVANKIKKESGLDYEPSQVLVSSGAKHSIYNILQAICNEGDEVIVPAPYWTSFPEMAKSAGAKPVIAQTDSNFKLSVTTLKKTLNENTKAIIINSPSNPTGAVYSAQELKAIAETILESDALVISDEIYEKLIYGNTKHISIATLSDKIRQRTIMINGVSKTYSMTGWRIGWAAGPKDIIALASKLQSQATSNPASISQRAALAALEGDQTTVENMRQEYQRRRDYVYERLTAIKGIQCTKPEGAFFIFPNVSKFYNSKLNNSTTFSERLLTQQGVAVVAGIAFGADQYIRISFAASMKNLEEGINRIEKFK